MRREIIVLLGALGVAGCATTEMPLNVEAIRDLGDRNVHIVKEEPPSFGAITAGKGMFAALGAIAAHSAGKDLVQEKGIEDPSRRVEMLIVEHLHAKFGTKSAGQVLDYTDADKPSDSDEWAAAADANSVIVDVETKGWNFWYFPTTWSRYRVGYSAVLKLIDGHTGETLSQYQCNVSGPESDDAAPTYDEMLSDRAALLKQMLRDRADRCASDIIAKVL